MKYIRTKEGIYEVEYKGWLSLDTKPKDVEVIVKNEKGNYEKITLKHRLTLGKKHWGSEIVKQADTIEELCDEFVCIFRNNQPWYVKDNAYTFEEWAKELKQNQTWIEDGYDVYGAIWTEWGLKYVAKMNDKGELELL